MLSITGVLFLFVVAGTVFYWQRNRHIQEVATHLARQYCERKQWQFLDGTTQFKGMQIKKIQRDWRLLREYHFDFFDGDVRLTGIVVMHKTSLLDIRIPNQKPETDVNTPEVNNVIPFPKRKH